MTTLNPGYFGQSLLSGWSGGPGQGQTTRWINDETGDDFSREWRNPNIVIGTVLMLVGGDVVRAALAQTTGKRFAPVCFSFGWVSYALGAVVDAFGNGRLLPNPDFPVKVYNIDSGYSRDNRNWVVGRIVRDQQALISREEALADNSIRIAIYKAGSRSRKEYSFRYTGIHVIGALTIITQLFIASIPTILTNGKEFGILLVTAVGTVLALIMGTLPQWKVEKLPNSTRSDQTYALTAGNGTRDIIIIKGSENCLDLEELAAAESPEQGRPWIKSTRFSRRTNSFTHLSKETLGLPSGFLITRCVTVVLAILWIILLITIPGLEGHMWYFLSVGGMGSFYNTLVAGMKRRPEERNLPLIFEEVIVTRRVMDGLMDLEVSHEKCGQVLIKEFFPGDLRKDEMTWWTATPSERPDSDYDRQRFRELHQRGYPRSMREAGVTTPGPHIQVEDQLQMSRTYSRRHSRQDLEQRLTALESNAASRPGSSFSAGDPSTSGNGNMDGSRLSIPSENSPSRFSLPQAQTVGSIDERVAVAVNGSSSQKPLPSPKQQGKWDKLSKPPPWD